MMDKQMLEKAEAAAESYDTSPPAWQGFMAGVRWALEQAASPANDTARLDWLVLTHENIRRDSDGWYAIGWSDTTHKQTPRELIDYHMAQEAK